MKTTLWMVSGGAGLLLWIPGAALAQAVHLGEVAGDNPRYLQVADSASLRPASITLECWVHPVGQGYGNSTSAALLIGRPGQGTSGNYLVSWGLYYVVATGQFYFEMAGPTYATNGQGMTSVATVPLGGTAHVAATYDGQTMKLYVNGVLDNQVIATYPTFNYTRPDSVTFGASNFAFGFARRFDGTLDEVRIWNGPRTTAQITANRDVRLCAGTPGLVGNWSFTGGSLLDTSGNGNNATAVTAVSFTAEVSALTNAGTILTQPQNASACPTGSAGFSVTAAGNEPPTYGWQIKVAPATWMNLTTSTSALPCGGSVTATAPTSAQTAIGIIPCPGVSAYQVRCLVSNTCGSNTSNEATYTVCYGNCDCSTAPPILNANDFQCFLNKYAGGDPSANCDGSTAPPILNANDFQCFLNAFAAACS